ncbi:MAG: hypothetical protein ABSG65_26750 [Bryobacteraceae bacterium]
MPNTSALEIRTSADVSQPAPLSAGTTGHLNSAQALAQNGGIGLISQNRLQPVRTGEVTYGRRPAAPGIGPATKL